MSKKRNLNPFDYAIGGVLENKTNATFLRNIGSLKTTIVEEWNKMSEEFILKGFKSFQMRVDTIIEKKMVAILSKFTYFVVYFFKLKFILLYSRV